MEAITTVAGTIAALILSEAFKEGGKSLGKSASEKITQLFKVIREKLKLAGTEVLLARVEKQPTEPTVAILEAELVTQMSEDGDFAQKLSDLIKQLESENIVTRQIAVSGVRAGTLKVGDVIQKAKKAGNVEQVIGSELDIDGDVVFGNLTQKG